MISDGTIEIDDQLSKMEEEIIPARSDSEDAMNMKVACHVGCTKVTKTDLNEIMNLLRIQRVEYAQGIIHYYRE